MAIAYDYAVVSVELGTLLLEEGRAREVRELAEEMMWIFNSQGIHKDALEALAANSAACLINSSCSGRTRTRSITL